jgi:hypothetical protein
MLVFIGFKKFKTSLTSSIEEGSLGIFFRLSLYSAWRKLVMSLGTFEHINFSFVNKMIVNYIVNILNLSSNPNLTLRFSHFG